MSKYQIFSYPILLSDGQTTTEFAVSAGRRVICHQAAPVGSTTWDLENDPNRKNALSEYDLAKINDFLNSNITQCETDKFLSGFSPEISLPISALFYKVKSEKSSLPIPQKPTSVVSNIIGGFGHHGFGPSFTEIMVTSSFGKNTLQNLSRIYKSVEATIIDKFDAISIMNGKEGAFAPNISTDLALEILSEAIDSFPNCGLAIDAAAASISFQKNKDFYYQIDGQTLSSQEMIKYYQNMLKKFPRFSYIEDAFHPLDIDSWKEFKKYIDVQNRNLLLVADDITATNSQIIKEKADLFNAVICKPNQASTITEFINAVKTAKELGILPIASQRSVETDDDLIVDLGLQTGCSYFKLGAPARERIVKYNSLYRILNYQNKFS